MEYELTGEIIFGDLLYFTTWAVEAWKDFL